MISVLLPYRDSTATLREAAGSVLADMDARDELLLIDDGSKDDGPAVARTLANDDRRVILVAAGGIGIAGALNRGLREARGAWIARMDADDVSLRGRLEAQRSMLEADASLGVVATRIDLFGAPGPGITRYADWQNAIVTAADHARAIFIESPVCHPSTMIRRTALDVVGGFHVGPFAEDYDLWLRLVAAGWSIAKVPRVLLRWRIHEASTTWNDPRLSRDAHCRLRARHLARYLALDGGRPFGVWGAGAAGRRLTRELALNGASVAFFIDIDPRKIGRVARGVPILSVVNGVARAREQHARIIVAVAAFGARDLVRERLEESGLVEGPDFLCAT